MPGTLLLVNPSAPRRKNNPEWAKRFGRGAHRAGVQARDYAKRAGVKARDYAKEVARDFGEGYRESRGNPAMYGRPMRLSAHRPSRPQKVEVGAKRTNPKKKKAAKKAASKKRSSEMRRRRKNPVPKDLAGMKDMAKNLGVKVTTGGRPATEKELAARLRAARRGRAKGLQKMAGRSFGLAAPAPAPAPAPAKKRSAPKKSEAKRSSSASKRSAAAKKGWRARRAAAAKRSRSRKSAARRAAPRSAARRRRRQPSLATIRKRQQNARSRLKRTKKGYTRRIHSSRRSALSLQSAHRRGKLSKRQSQMMRRHGLTRVNPSLKAAMQDFIGLIPEMGVGVLATAGAAWAGQKAGAKLASMTWMPAAVKPFAVPVATSGVTIVAYAASKMSSKTQRFSLPILVGGMAAVAVHTLAAVKTKEGQSLGQKLGLPIGNYVAIGEYIPQSLGAHYGEHLGDFVGIGAPVLDVDGAEVRLNGMFSESSLGTEMPATFSQMGYGREPARALNSPGDPTVEEVLGEESGVLSGSIFD